MLMAALMGSIGLVVLIATAILLMPYFSRRPFE
jgi:hypothetical protein